MKKLMTVAVFSTLLALAGCEKKVEEVGSAHGHDEDAPAAEMAMPDDAAHSTVPAAHMEAASESENTGQVVEFSNVPGYTYALVSTHDGDAWFAGPSAELTVGQTVYWSEGAVMNAFTSKALGKSFDTIMFIDGYLHAPAAMATADMHQDAAPAGSGQQGKVVTAQVAAGYLYLEVATGNGNVWIASPAQEIVEGDSVSWANADAMSNFTSKSLGRTFATIYFAGSVTKI